MLTVSNHHSRRLTRALRRVARFLNQGKGMLPAAALCMAGTAVAAPASAPAFANGGGPFWMPTPDQASETGGMGLLAYAGSPSQLHAMGHAEPTVAGLARWVHEAEAEIECMQLFQHTSLLERARPLTDAEVLANFDRDHDGVLDARELQQSKQAQKERAERRAHLVRQFDANGNGRLDALEMSRARGAELDARKALLLKRFDANHNGQLDPSEASQVRMQRKRAEQLARLIPHFDLDHDGQLSALEKRRMAHFLAATQGARSEQEPAVAADSSVSASALPGNLLRRFLP